MELLAFDPGQTTGWASINWSAKDPISQQKFHAGILGPHQHHVELWGLLDTFRPDRIIVEHFVPQTRGDAPASAMELISRNYEGVIELWCAMHQVPLKKQNASEGKGLWTTAKMEIAGLWKPSRHSRDAMSHLLHYITTDLRDYRWLRTTTG